MSRAFGGQFRVLQLGSFHMPTLAGAPIAPGGFVSGHLGYGGLYDNQDCAVKDIAALAAGLRSAERELGLPCARLILPPMPDSLPGLERLGCRPLSTAVKQLCMTPRALAKGYTANIRNQLRAGDAGGLVARRVTVSDLPAVTTLVWATQARVGATYRTPEALLELFAHDTDRLFGVGVWDGLKMVAVGCFVVDGSIAGYYLNGREPTSPVANAVMLDAGFRYLVDQGVREVDLGFSHTPSIQAWKDRWNVQHRCFYRIVGLELDALRQVNRNV